MTDEHHIIPGRVGRKPLEWQLLMAEILQRPVGQFVTAAFMITGNQSIYGPIQMKLRNYVKVIKRIPTTIGIILSVRVS